MNKETIEKYFAGETTTTEELELLQYFTTEEIAPEVAQYQNYFCGLAALKTNANLIISAEDYENFSNVPKSHFYYIKRFGISFAAAASVALFLFFFTKSHNNSDFVVINGKKYTDDKHIELAFQASLENVKLNIESIFDDLDNDLFN